MEQCLLEAVKNDYTLVGGTEGSFVLNDDLLDYAEELYDVFHETWNIKFIAKFAYVNWKRFNKDISPLKKDDTDDGLIEVQKFE